MHIIIIISKEPINNVNSNSAAVLHSVDVVINHIPQWLSLEDRADLPAASQWVCQGNGIY